MRVLLTVVGIGHLFAKYRCSDSAEMGFQEIPYIMLVGKRGSNSPKYLVRYLASFS